jgi:hypothetical protein
MCNVMSMKAITAVQSSDRIVVLYSLDKLFPFFSRQ